MRQRSAIVVGLATAASGLALLAACVGDDPLPAVNEIDAASGTDSGVDSANPVDANEASSDAGTFCATQDALICEDFDQGDLEVRGWSLDPADDGGTVSIEATPTRSAPGALHSKSSAGNPNSWPRYLRTANVSSATTKWTYEADILVVKRESPGNALTVIGFTFAAASGAPVVVNLAADGTVEFIAFGQGGTSPLTFPLQQWHHVVLHVERVGSTYTAECTIDTQPTVSFTGLTGTVTQDRRLTVGLVNYQGNGAAEAVYDNVVFRTE